MMEFRARQVRLDADGPGPNIKGLWVVRIPLRSSHVLSE